MAIPPLSSSWADKALQILGYWNISLNTNQRLLLFCHQEHVRSRTLPVLSNEHNLLSVDLSSSHPPRQSFCQLHSCTAPRTLTQIVRPFAPKLMRTYCAAEEVHGYLFPLKWRHQIGSHGDHFRFAPHLGQCFLNREPSVVRLYLHRGHLRSCSMHIR